MDFAGERFIFADIGPVPVNEEKDLLEAYKEIANTFLECGAQNFLLKQWRAEKPLKKLHRISKRKHREVLSPYLLAASPGRLYPRWFLCEKAFLGFTAV